MAEARKGSPLFDQCLGPLAVERQRQGLTSQELSARIGVSDQLVAKWEAGERIPSLFLFQCWVQALGMKVVYEQVRKCEG